MGNFFTLGFYMDDSADRSRKTVFSVAGFLGYGLDWDDLEKEWEKRVKRDGIDYFRTYDCKSLSGEFEKLVLKYGLTTARVFADAMLKDLKDMVHKAPLAAYCLGVLMDDFREAIKHPDAQMVLTDDPYFAAHQQVIILVALDACRLTPPEPVAFVYDEHSKAKALAGGWNEFKKNNPNSAKCMTTLAPLDDRQTPALQIADLIANTTTEIFVALKDEPERAEAIIRAWSPRLRSVTFWTKEYLLKHVVPGNVGMVKEKRMNAIKQSSEYEKFDNAMTELLKVPHSEIKAKLDAEKAAKTKKKRKAKKPSASGRASRDED